MSSNKKLGLVFREGSVLKAGILDAAAAYSGSDDGYRASLAIDANGALHVSYYARLDNGRYGLKYGTNAGRAWRFRTPVSLTSPDSGYYTGQWSGIGVDPAGKVHIAYHKYDYIPYSTSYTSRVALDYLTW